MCLARRQRWTSQTAEAAAFGRAIESLRRRDDRLVDDPFAQLFVNRRRQLLLAAMRVPGIAAALLSLHDFRLPGVLGNLLCRTRFIDEALIEAVGAEIGQVVILGSGFDSRAYRMAALKRLPTFELDYPHVFSKKRPLLETALGAFPANVKLCGVDFDRQRLGDSLAEAGFNPLLPTFFIWEGVTQYLTTHAIDDVLGYVAGSAAGSRIALSYINHAVIKGIPERKIDATIKRWVKRLGEPWISGFVPSQVGAYLAARRLAIDIHAGAAEYRRRYLEPSGRSLTVYDEERVVIARVSG